MTSEERLNLRYRNGGPPVEQRDYVRDCLTEMAQAEHRPDMVWNALAAMGCPVVTSERINTGASGL
jgi:hypothetical protein